MVIGFVGDVHGRVLTALAAIVEWQRVLGRRLDFIVQVGDMGAFPDMSRADLATQAHYAADPGQAQFARLIAADAALAARLRELRAELAAPMHFLRGNHEDFAWLAKLSVDPTAQTAAVDGCDLLRYVPDATLLDVGGMRLAFLGGVEEQSGPPGIDAAAYERLMALPPDSIDVLVTHEGPYGSSIGYHGDTHGSRLISVLIERLRPRFCVAGHAHQLSGPTTYGSTLYLGLDGIVAAPLWHPEARGLQPGCLALLDTARGELTPVMDGWLQHLPTHGDGGPGTGT